MFLDLGSIGWVRWQRGSERSVTASVSRRQGAGDGLGSGLGDGLGDWLGDGLGGWLGGGETGGEGLAGGLGVGSGGAGRTRSNRLDRIGRSAAGFRPLMTERNTSPDTFFTAVVP
jgi:hypothetical protein